MWWETHATTQRKLDLQKLLNTKQFEFVNGGMVMHDDASPTYSAAIDQTTQGHQYLVELFGEQGIPNSGYTIDPFGCSAVTAKINAEFGFTRHVVHRINLQKKAIFNGQS
jgi:hypothetical protein